MKQANQSDFAQDFPTRKDFLKPAGVELHPKLIHFYTIFASKSAPRILWKI